jgi:GntR family transcriptional regulator, transcriptional repressor for pyruvate dehydrogenase complex
MTQPHPVSFEKVHSRRTFEVVSNRIRKKIAAGELQPGDKLPAEREMAAQFGVSRSAVREALRSLEITGVVQLKKGVKGGAFIVGGTPDRMAMAMLDLVNLDAISLKDLTEARILLLESVVKLATERMTEADFNLLEANIAETENVIDSGILVDRPSCAQEFYHLLAMATGNSALVFLVDAQTTIVQKYLTYRKWNMPKDQLLMSRRKLVGHLRAKDAKAAAVELAKHLQTLQETLWA